MTESLTREAQTNNGSFWFRYEATHEVHYFSQNNEWTCTCTGDTFRQSGRKQRECKHIKMAKERHARMTAK